jgi:phosphopantothenoylcysteine decarboxylase/phosphopantothenate--cysteine ligase
MSEQGRVHVLLGVSGSIAAYKAVQLASDLVKEGFEVRACLTPGATHFLAPLSFEAITAQPVTVQIWDEHPAGSRIGHVELGKWADIVVIAPASANLLARIALGLADDMLTAVALTTQAPLVLAPAMETQMWHHPATQANLNLLRQRDVTIVGPETGRLASGADGEGRMSEPEAVVEIVRSILQKTTTMSGIRVLVTAGPTYEAIDPVRFIGNRSSGKMGYALARAARTRGAHVKLIAGPTALPDPPGIRVIHVESGSELRDAALEHTPNQDVVVMAAAVSDYSPAVVAERKIKRDRDLFLELVPTPDIAAELSASATHALHVGFALETANLVEAARAKLLRKGQQLVVANPLSAEFSPFGADTNRATLVTATTAIELPEMSKLELANRIWDEVERMLAGKGRVDPLPSHREG